MRRLLVSAVALALCWAGTAQAAVTLGTTNGATDNCGGTAVYMKESTAAAPSYVAPSSGVITSWSYLAHTGAPTIKFKVYRPTNATTWFLRSESASHAPGTGAGQVHPNQLNTYTESPGLPIQQGDHLGITASGGTGLGCITTTTLRTAALPIPACTRAGARWTSRS